MADDPFRGVTWVNVLELNVEGRLFDGLPHPFARLPERVRDRLPPQTWREGCSPSGLSVRFRTDARDIFIRWSLSTAVGPCSKNGAVLDGGFDCYGRDDEGRWRWVGAAFPWRHPNHDGRINKSPLDGRKREYRLIFPVRCIVEKVEIGIDESAVLEAALPDCRKPIVVYGTSIVHGVAVSRPGMKHTDILSRRLDYPVANCGLAGRAKMEAAIAELLGEVDAALYILDCLPNMSPELIAERLEGFVRMLRSARPQTPILLVGDRLFTDASFCPERYESNRLKNEAQKSAFDRLTGDGIEGIHLFQPENLLGDDFEGAVDGSHPTDLGAMRIADALEPHIRRLVSL